MLAEHVLSLLLQVEQLCYEKGLLFNQKHILVQFSWRLSSCAGRKMGSNTVKTVESEPWQPDSKIIVIIERHVRNQNKDLAAKKKNVFSVKLWETFANMTQSREDLNFVVQFKIESEFPHRMLI